jgi:hypothetical protein
VAEHEHLPSLGLGNGREHPDWRRRGQRQSRACPATSPTQLLPFVGARSALFKPPPLGATMDDCCRISELLLGAAPRGEALLTIAILTIVSQFELSVSVVYTANPLSGDGVSIDVECISSRILRLRG